MPAPRNDNAGERLAGIVTFTDALARGRAGMNEPIQGNAHAPGGAVSHLTPATARAVALSHPTGSQGLGGVSHFRPVGAETRHLAGAPRRPNPPPSRLAPASALDRTDGRRGPGTSSPAHRTRSRNAAECIAGGAGAPPPRVDRATAVDYARRHWHRGPSWIARDTGYPVTTVAKWGVTHGWGPSGAPQGRYGRGRIDWAAVRDALRKPGANWKAILYAPAVNTSSTVLRRTFAQRGWLQPSLRPDGRVCWPAPAC